jgi:hypothetical protein
MRTSWITTRLVAGALAVAALSVTVVTFAPPEAAHAQSGYRVCGVWNSQDERSSAPHGDRNWWPGDSDLVIGTGLVTKVWMKGGETCDSKLGYMKVFYGDAYWKSTAEHSFRMSRCEDFSSAVGGQGWDMCYSMTVNKIYKYTSRWDKWHPTYNPTLTFWKD